MRCALEQKKWLALSSDQSAPQQPKLSCAKIAATLRIIIAQVNVLKRCPSLLPSLLFLLILFGLLAMLGRAFIEELRVGLHKEFQYVEGEAMYGAVPMLLRVRIESADDNREQCLAILVDELHDVIIVPQEERSLGNLEVRACDAARNAAEELLLHAVELRWLCELQCLLQLIQEEHLLRSD